MLVIDDEAIVRAQLRRLLERRGYSVVEAGSGTECIVLRDDGARSYRKLVLRDGCLAGAVLVGDTTDALWYVDLMRSGAAVAVMRDALVFGRAYTEAA